MANEHKISRVIIDGIEIRNYSEYSFIHRRTYQTSPTRLNGVINDLNTYKVYVTPELSFSFDLMPLEIYRTLMQIYNSKNEHIVIAYDILNDVDISCKMYFEPKEMEKWRYYTRGQGIEQQVETLRAVGAEFRLVGTNADMDLMSIIFNANGGTSEDRVYSADVAYGMYFTTPDSNSFTKQGYVLDSFNTKPDGTGIKYPCNYTFMVTNPLTLYAIYTENVTYTIYYNYSSITPDEGINFENSKQVTYGQPIGDLYTPIKNGYTFDGWYWVIPNTNIVNLESVRVEPYQIYQNKYNVTIYAKWTQNE